MPRTGPSAGRSTQGHFDNTALFEFSRVVNASLELPFILNHILLTIMGKILSSRGMVVLAHGDGHCRVEMVKGFPPGLLHREFDVQRVPVDLVDPKAVHARSHPWIKFFREAGVATLLPLFSGNTLVGFLGFGESAGRRPLRDQEFTYLRSIANLSATAIERVRVVAELQLVNRRLDGKLQELNTLLELGKEFGAVLDPEKLVRLLVFVLLGHTGTGRYLICAKEGADVRILAQRIDGPSPQGELLAGILHVRTPSLVTDMVIGTGPDPRPLLTRLGLLVVVPMVLQDQTRGLILLGERLDRQPFAPGDLELVSSIGNLASIALENARLFKEAIEKQRMEDELVLAREIQKGLLPGVFPPIRGVSIGATNISSKQVGGDYYDVLALPDERYVIAIGDVSGKGPPASLLMANLQATIRALVPLNLTLSELTARVNDLMCQNTGGNKFVTFFWGIVDAVTRSLTYVNAGHNYPMLLRRDGTVERLERGGMILGVLKTTTPYEEETVPLRDGDVLLLFTDGVSEAMSKESVEYGEERLLSTVQGCKDCEPDAIIARIHDDILQHSAGASQSDDITMMVLKVG
jgi:phosphoserine phosphatase RsbU/P